MTTPSKPDLVALADEPLTPIERVRLALAMSDAGYSFDPGIDDVIELLEAYDRLASQPSLYEAGLRDMRERAKAVADDFSVKWSRERGCHEYSSITIEIVCDDIAAAIAALPAEGGEVDYDTNDPMGVERSWPTSDVIDDGVYTDDPRLAQPSIGPSEATPSTAGSVREALEKLLIENDDDDFDDDCELCDGRGTVDAYTRRDHESSGRDEVGCPACLERKQSRDVRAVLAALAPVEAPVAVKPLEWNEYEDGEGQAPDRWDAETACGTFYGIALLPDGFSVEYDYRAVAKSLASLDAAKAAAQADYEQRIRSALIATARPLPSVDDVADNKTILDTRTDGERREYQKGREDERATLANPILLDRNVLGRIVREAWVRWALTQDAPKAHWLLPYGELSEPDKEADRQIGEAVVDFAKLSIRAFTCQPGKARS